MKRRSFIRKSGFTAMASVAGMPVVFSSTAPQGYQFLGNKDPDPFSLFDLDNEMLVLNNRPFNIEAQAHLLDDKITPNEKMFIRNNGIRPKNIDESSWTLTIDGESVINTKSYSLDDLKQNFKVHTYQVTLECGGNGRSEFNPPAKGNQWSLGAVHNASWTGVRLKDVLADVGVKNDAMYIGYHAVDLHLSGDVTKEVISRGIPIEKANQDETLIAFEMNGQPIPLIHGHPLRLIAGGYPASASGKWINRLSIRNKEHDGPKMKGMSYRVPAYPVAPGQKVPEEDMRIIESMPVKSLITYPKTGAILDKSKSLDIRGHAWAGEKIVTSMHYSIDFGATWHECELEKPINRFAWQHFTANISFSQPGYYEVWAKATDNSGIQQPMLVPGWNPKGYLNNACHRIAVKIM